MGRGGEGGGRGKPLKTQVLTSVTRAHIRDAHGDNWVIPPRKGCRCVYCGPYRRRRGVRARLAALAAAHPHLAFYGLAHQLLPAGPLNVRRIPRDEPEADMAREREHGPLIPPLDIDR